MGRDSGVISVSSGVFISVHKIRLVSKMKLKYSYQAVVWVGKSAGVSLQLDSLSLKVSHL